MIARALWVGMNLGCSCPEFVIIPEKPNESKGLLRRLALTQVLDRTGFFAVNGQFGAALNPSSSN
jgi:hypothetical protein